MADKQINPIFDLPPNVDGWVYDDAATTALSDNYIDDYVDSELSDVINTNGAALPDSTDDTGGVTLMPPDNIVILEQVTRVDADGNTVVDVIVDVDGQPGTLQYDVRYTAR